MNENDSPEPRAFLRRMSGNYPKIRYPLVARRLQFATPPALNRPMFSVETPIIDKQLDESIDEDKSGRPLTAGTVDSGLPEEDDVLNDSNDVMEDTVIYRPIPLPRLSIMASERIEEEEDSDDLEYDDSNTSECHSDISMSTRYLRHLASKRLKQINCDEFLVGPVNRFELEPEAAPTSSTKLTSREKYEESTVQQSFLLDTVWPFDDIFPPLATREDGQSAIAPEIPASKVTQKMVSRGDGDDHAISGSRRSQAPLPTTPPEVRAMITQLRNALCHLDLAEASGRDTMKKVHKKVVDVKKVLEMEKTLKRREEQLQRREDTLKLQQKRVDELVNELDNQQKMLMIDESARVRTLKEKLRETEKKLEEKCLEMAQWIANRSIEQMTWDKERREWEEMRRELEEKNSRLRTRLDSSKADKRKSFMPRDDEDTVDRFYVRRSGRKTERLSIVTTPKNTTQSPRVLGSPSQLPLESFLSISDKLTISENMYVVEEFPGRFGKCTKYRDTKGTCTEVTATYCGCAFFEYSNGDFLWTNADKSIMIHHIFRVAVQIAFENSSTAIRYFNKGGVLEIFREGEGSTRVTSDGERVELVPQGDGFRVERFLPSGVVIVDDGESVRESPTRPLHRTPRSTSEYAVDHRNQDGSVEWAEQQCYVRRFRDGNLKINFKDRSQSQLSLYASDGGCGRVSHRKVFPGGRTECATCIEWVND